MIISDLDYIEDNNDTSITGGFGNFEGFQGFTVINEGSVGIQLNTEIRQNAQGTIVSNESNLTLNLNVNDFNIG